MSKTRQSRLLGPVVALRTFRTEDGKLDLEKQRRQLRWMIDQGINEGNGVVMGAAGGGEGYFMDDDEWKAIIDLTAEECKGRVPGVGGIFGTAHPARADRSSGKAKCSNGWWSRSSRSKDSPRRTGTIGPGCRSRPRAASTRGSSTPERKVAGCWT